MVGKAGQQELEEAGHMVSVVRKKKVINTSARFLCLRQSRTPVHGIVPIFRVGLPTSVNLVREPSQACPAAVSGVTLDPVKLTTTANRHPE